MKSIGLLLSLAISSAFVSPAMAQQFGMDQQYNAGMNQAAQGPANNSKADTGNFGYTTQDNAWQDMGYVQNQYAPMGNFQAPIMRTNQGSISTFKGTMGNFLKGSMMSGQSLPVVQQGLQALSGGYTGPACGQAGTGGFWNAGGGSVLYPALPPTSTSTVDLNTAF
jgi:hypothetical protein